MTSHKFNYLLFGELRLSDPEKHLDSERLKQLYKLRPLLDDLTYREKPRNHSYHAVFKCFVEKEVAELRRLGVDRPAKYNIPPSGSMEARVACHLNNSTFFVKDPELQITDDPSSPSIKQINGAGFSSKNCFIFDRITRREHSEDLTRWPSTVLQIHREFIDWLREHMAAVVEICWGKPVRQDQEKFLILEPLELWGHLKGFTLYLEMNKSRDKIRRFLIFVYHPQFFMMRTTDSEKGQQVRETFSKQQDSYLEIAAELAGIVINKGFYQFQYHPSYGARLTNDERVRARKLEQEAVEQLKVAVPHTFNRSPPDEIAEIENVLSATSAPPMLKTNENSIEAINEISRRHNEVLQNTISLRKVVEEVISSKFDAYCYISLESSEWSEISIWDHLPESLTSWFQTQDGLKFNRLPINSNDDLLKALHLLHIEYVSTDSLIVIAFKVAFKYLAKISRSRKEVIKDDMIPGFPPRNIMPLECSQCGNQILDDSLAFYSKANTREYLFIRRNHGCGLPGCSGTAQLQPSDHKQPRRRANKKDIQRSKTAQWYDYMILLPEQCRELPSAVTLRCLTCSSQKTDERVRWTAEKKPRYVVRILDCTRCGKNAKWFPVDKKIPFIDRRIVEHKWYKLRTAEFNPYEYPRWPELILSDGRNDKKREILKAAKVGPMSEKTIKEILTGGCRAKRRWRRQIRRMGS